MKPKKDDLTSDVSKFLTRPALKDLSELSRSMSAVDKFMKANPLLNAQSPLVESMSAADKFMKANPLLNAQSPLVESMSAVDKFMKANPLLIAQSPFVESMSAMDKFMKANPLLTAQSPLVESMSAMDKFMKANPLPGSLLQMSTYKDLGIDSTISKLQTSLFEQAHTNIRSAFLSTSVATQLAESNLSKFEWSNLGSRFQIAKAQITNVQKDFLDFSKNYRDVLETVGSRPNWVYEASNVARSLALDYYTSTGILRVVTEDDVVEEIVEKANELSEADRDILAEYLPKLHPDLPIMWHGALHALKSDNPDKIRHFITSLRELFTHVLHIMAPDAEFEHWDNTKTYYVDGNPTRRGRFLYICRNMSGSDKAFAKFIENDVNSVLSLIGLFQGGTHKIKSDFSPKDLELIRIRAEMLLRTFLTVEFEINRR